MSGDCCGFGGSTPSPAITLTAGVDVEDEGVNLGTFTTLNFVGDGVTAANAGGGVATITVPGTIQVQQDGAPIGNFSIIDCVTGLAATDAGGGRVTIAAVPMPLWLPEQWAENNIRRNLANHVMDCQVSTSFDTFKVITSGSITAVSTRLSETITAGAISIAVTINGVATALTLLHTNASNQNGGIATAAVGAIPYVSGDLIGVFISTNNTLAPLSNDIEAMLQVTE